MIKRRRKLSVSLGYRCKAAQIPTIGKNGFKNQNNHEHNHSSSHNDVTDDDHSLAKSFKNLPIFTIEKTGGNAVWVGPGEWRA